MMFGIARLIANVVGLYSDQTSEPKFVNEDLFLLLDFRSYAISLYAVRFCFVFWFIQQL